MIIKKLIVNNFRLFQGRHEIQLMTNSHENKPIILFGGLNGSGKTSILLAVRLALYGKMAFKHLARNQDYIELLSSMIYRNPTHSDNPTQASIELVFTYNQAGLESEFSIIRDWQYGCQDTLLLSRNGQPLAELSYEQSQGFLNELIPPGVADLFFFDGEKIADLAEDETGHILQIAIRRLFGLDLIDKLRHDLIIFLKRNNFDNMDKQYQQQLTILEHEKQSYLTTAQQLRDEAALIKQEIDQLTTKINKQENLLSTQGGAFALTKSQESAKAENLIKEKESLEKLLRQEFDGMFPLALAPKMLTQLLQQLTQESQIKQTISFKKELYLFLEQLKLNLAQHNLSKQQTVYQIIENQLVDYLSNKSSTEILFDVSDTELGRYQHLISVESIKAQSRFEQAQARLSEVEIALENASLNIQRAPDEEQLLTIFAAIRELDKARQQQIEQYKQRLEQAKQALSSAKHHAVQIQKIHDHFRANFTLNNAVTYAQKILPLLEQYSLSLTKSRIKLLEQNFIAAYTRLNRKQHQYLSAKIDSETFDVELINQQGQLIHRQSLSAGEKQIYAIAILEALGKTSGRQLPIIIDTPLGRLDSEHRDKLIKYYFPLASHQVIILSTDTELDQHYFVPDLNRHIAHSYQIVFDHLHHTSHIKNGYLWSIPSPNKEIN
jgi:DNA sulfur modification protein DndD